ncbi:MAG: RidA family protein [Polyangiaceae bacterium]|nr:RidA family protein [Polyangiaceae bacterium]
MDMSITRMNPHALPDAGRVGYSQISIAPAGPLAFVSGQVAWRRNGEPVPPTLGEQTQIVIENLRAALDALGAGPHDIAMLRAYLTDLRPETQETVMALLLPFLNGAQPSITGVGVAALATPELQLEIEMTVRVPG